MCASEKATPSSPDPIPPYHPLLRIGIGIAVLVCFFLALRVREYWTIDDALIYQNYVRNLVEGRGLIYGPNTTAEGYSSPIWLGLLVLLGTLGAQGLLVAKTVGALLGTSCILAIVFFLPRRVPPLLAGAAGLLLSLQPAFAWWSISGLDTPLFAALLLVMFLGALNHHLWVVAIAVGLTSLARPESPLFACMGLAWIGLEYRRGMWSGRRTLIAIAICVLPGATWLLFRLIYYDAWIANSALAKLETSAGAWAAFSYVANGIHHLAPVWLVGSLAAAVEWWRRSDLDDERYARMLSPLLFAASFVFVFVSSGDWMPWSRFFVPVVPVVVAWAAVVCAGHTKERTAMVVGAWSFALLLSAALQYRDTVPAYSIHLPSQYSMVARAPQGRTPFVDPLLADPVAHFYAAMTLRFTKPDDMVLHVDIGQPGYLSADIGIMDAYGLVSRFEAEFLAGRHQPEEMLKRFRTTNPSVVFLLINPTTGHPTMPVTLPLARTLSKSYTAVARAPWKGGQEMIVLVRPDALRRTTDASRLDTWSHASPGLRFDRQVVLDLADDVDVEEHPDLESADYFNIHGIGEVIGWQR